MKHLGGVPQPSALWKRLLTYTMSVVCLAVAVGTWWSPQLPSRIASVVAWVTLAVFWYREGQPRGAK